MFEHPIEKLKEAIEASNEELKKIAARRQDVRDSFSDMIKEQYKATYDENEKKEKESIEQTEKAIELLTKEGAVEGMGYD